MKGLVLDTCWQVHVFRDWYVLRQPLGGRNLGKTNGGRAFEYVRVCIRVQFCLSPTCTDSKVSRKQLSLRALIIEIKVTSSWRWSLIEFPRPVHDVGTGVRRYTTLRPWALLHGCSGNTRQGHMCRSSFGHKCFFFLGDQ